MYLSKISNKSYCLLINYRHYGLKTVKRAKKVALKHLAMVLMLDGISKPLKLP